MRLCACLMLLGLLVAVPASAATVEVQVAGSGARAGTLRLPTGARFADAVLAALPDAQADYPLAAAVLRREAEPAQRRLKAGLLYDLRALAAAETTPPELAQHLDALHDWVQAMPVTGRVTGQLDPRRLEADRASNRVLAAGDRFLYPPRPDLISVVGAVAHRCQLPHAPVRDAADYLRDCPRATAADRDELFVIQPDGQVQRFGIAAWNRGADQAVAPGGVIYVPLQARVLRGVAEQFNGELAAFLATQVLPVSAP